jgi:hypothetical protein
LLTTANYQNLECVLFIEYYLIMSLPMLYYKFIDISLLLDKWLGISDYAFVSKYLKSHRELP